jgi:hypothetical protein
MTEVTVLCDARHFAGQPVGPHTFQENAGEYE